MPSLRLHRVLVAASVLMPLGLFAAAAAHNRADVLRQGEAAVVRTVTVMDEHARKVFETGELLLGRVDDRIRGMGWDEIASPAMNDFLAGLIAPLEQVVSIWVTDAQGMVRAGSQVWDPSMSIAGREFFQVQREANAGPFVSASFLGRATRVPSFALSQRRSTEDGHFDGIVHISLSPEYFTRYYASSTPEVALVAALLRADGAVLARVPEQEPAPTRLPPDSRLLRQFAAQSAGGSFLGVTAPDGVERAYAYRRVGNYPLYVALGVDKAALLQRWRGNMVLFGAVSGAASFMLLLVSWLALRGVQAERAAMGRLRAALENLRRETRQREAAEQRVRQAQKMEAVGQLTGGIAHDFNNLLTAVLGSLQLLRKRLPAGDERATRLLENAFQGAQRGASLTQRLLAFSRGQALRPAAVDLVELVRGMSDLLRSSLGTGVKVETKFPLGLAPAHVDANQLELALLNLAMNARDAMGGQGGGQGGSQGQLTIFAREERVQEGGELPEGHYVVLGVTDNGVGMDEATLARCVEPFFTTKGIGKGTGLGLSMVYGLAAQSNGRLVLRSRLGEGTTAELWLPRAQPAAPALPEPSASEAARPRPEGFGRRTVMVVDDDPLVLASTGSMLEDVGHAVVEASSGRQALEILRAGAKVDMVLTDQVMPGMTGVQLGAELRRLWPGLPVLLGTGYAERAELLGSGLPLLAKPFQQAELVAAVEACLGRAEPVPGAGRTVVPFRPVGG
ncbi:response regulator [Roseomonas sp. KE2513]|uniref:response regulator n=1 Tax=Roseomonas sp. KE2513 TaxID=2479202 RepID=UPI0018DFCCBD|nr:response regulator [Roseomonas sp. KE2513]MBI0534793.1 response regulator [Roseomonas sp. KE2513]